jgi:hypothetical protein
MIANDRYDNPAPLNERAKGLLAVRIKSLQLGTPYINASALCHPTGIPWTEDLNFPFHIFQSKDRMEALFQENHDLWSIAIDPAQKSTAAAAGGRTYTGHSIAHWDGDTLVAEITA